MNGATKREMAEFKRIKAAERAAVTHADAREVKRMVADWVRSAQSIDARQRRKRMANAVRFAHSEFPDESPAGDWEHPVEGTIFDHSR